MSGTPVGKLPDAFRDYLANPTIQAALTVQAALAEVPVETGELVRFLLEMIVNLKGELETKNQLCAKLEELLVKAKGITVTNIAQTGGKNAAQTGSGTQTISGEDQEAPRDGDKR